jgi:hypothetical protein
MADFSTPFAEGGDRRFASPTEQQEGFPCGPAERALFNGELYRLEAELGEVIEFAGITPSNDRMTQVREAIQALINAATGEGDTSDYLLMSQARARLPFFPDVLNVDGRITCLSPATGVVRIPGGVTFQHRGVYPITTVQTDLTTSLSQTYHLRWDPTNGYRLRNLTDAVYNVNGDPENSIKFDSSYDDMLIARVTTNSSNVVTITNLANKVRIASEFTAPPKNFDGTYQNGRTLTHTINNSRVGVPTLMNQTPPGNSYDSDYYLVVTGNDRYACTVYSWTWQHNNPAPNNIQALGYTYTVLA